MKLPHAASKIAAAALVFFLGVMSCSGTKINQENFEKIKTGMTFAEVKVILGEPTESSSVDVAVFSGTTATWKKGETTINIQFMNGKVIAKEFLKPGEKGPKPQK